jgi:predicted transcriptional regulator
VLAVRLQPDLAERLEETATAKETTPDDLLDLAVRSYLRQMDRETIKAEAEAYRAMHPKLIEQYLHKYVAIHRNAVVDVDVDFQSLHDRIRKQFGQLPVLLRRVEQEPERTLVFRSPRFEGR